MFPPKSVGLRGDPVPVLGEAVGHWEPSAPPKLFHATQPLESITWCTAWRGMQAAHTAWG